MSILNEHEKHGLETLLNLSREPSGDVWGVLANASDELLVSYLLEKVGSEKINDILSKIKTDNVN